MEKWKKWCSITLCLNGVSLLALCFGQYQLRRQLDVQRAFADELFRFAAGLHEDLDALRVGAGIDEDFDTLRAKKDVRSGN